MLQIIGILQNPMMISVLQACANPQVLRQVLGHPVYGPNLRKLAEVGLVNLGEAK